jgi:hypothetical protein
MRGSIDGAIAASRSCAFGFAVTPRLPVLRSQASESLPKGRDVAIPLSERVQVPSFASARSATKVTDATY